MNRYAKKSIRNVLEARGFNKVGAQYVRTRGLMVDTVLEYGSRFDDESFLDVAVWFEELQNYSDREPSTSPWHAKLRFNEFLDKLQRPSPLDVKELDWSKEEYDQWFSEALDITEDKFFSKLTCIKDVVEYKKEDYARFTYFERRLDDMSPDGTISNSVQVVIPKAPVKTVIHRLPPPSLIDPQSGDLSLRFNRTAGAQLDQTSIEQVGKLSYCRIPHGITREELKKLLRNADLEFWENGKSLSIKELSWSPFGWIHVRLWFEEQRIHAFEFTGLTFSQAETERLMELSLHKSLGEPTKKFGTSRWWRQVKAGYKAQRIAEWEMPWGFVRFGIGGPERDPYISVDWR